jgi:hypothetical protein
VLAAQPLAQRIAPDERAELRHELGMPATLEIGVDARLDGGKPELLERRRFAGREGGVDVGERRAAEEPVRLAEHARALGEVGDRACVGDRGAEPVEVELARLDAEQVSGRAGDEPVAEHLAQTRDLVLKRCVRVPGRRLPQLLDEPVRGHHTIRVQEQVREQGTLARPAERERSAVLADGLDRTEK